MTIEQLRKYKGCEHYSDEEAEEVVSSLRTLAIILIETWPKNCSANGTDIKGDPLTVKPLKK